MQKTVVSLLLLVTLVSACTAATKETGNPTPAGRQTGTPSPTGRPATATGLPLTGLIAEASGSVDARDAGQADFLPAVVGDVLQTGGLLQTGADGRARLDLSSGSFVRVAPNSIFQLISNQPTSGGLWTRLQLLTGRIYILLHGGSLDVETSSGLASVRGSYMMVESAPESGDALLVSCLEGFCRVENAAGSVTLLAGQKALITGAHPDILPQIELLSQAEIDEWVAFNPEARTILDAVAATRTALPPLPTRDPRLPTRTPLLDGTPPDVLPKPTDPILPRPTDPILPRPTDPILPRPTDPILPRPTDPILPRPTRTPRF